MDKNVISHSKLLIMEGQDAKIECLTDNVAMWFYLNSTYSGNIKRGKNSITIADVRKRQKGIYKCKSYNEEEKFAAYSSLHVRD